jgi:hypothetical protein
MQTFALQLRPQFSGEPVRPRAALSGPRTGRLPRARGGFTLMELVMGMIVTGLVMSAIAGLLSAVAMGWEQNGRAQANSVHRVQAHARIQRILKGVKQLGAVRHGSVDGTTMPAAAVMFWKSDDNGDSKVQFSELALLAHEGAVGTPGAYVSFYDVAYPTSWSAAQRTAADSTPPVVTEEDIYKDSSIDTFRTMTYVRKQLVASNVVGVAFTRTDGAVITRPSLDYVLKFIKDGETHVEYGTTAVRTPTTLPASQR